MSELPYVDEQAVLVAAGADTAWIALTETLDRAFGRTAAATYARLVGCVDTAVSGPRPLISGSAMPGFRVVDAVPGSTLLLEGSHYFASYTLRFWLRSVSASQSSIAAETRAYFPGVPGRLYRLLVIKSGGHTVVLRRLLARIRRRSQQLAGPAVQT